MNFRCAIIASAMIVMGSGACADELTIIADTFHTNPRYLVENLPPRPDVWPGAIYTANLRIPIKYGDPKDPAIHAGERVSIASDQAFRANVGGSGAFGRWFGVSTDAGDVAELSISFPDARILDMNEKDLEDHIRAAGETIDSIKSGEIPVIVIRVFEGTPTFKLMRKAGASADAWARLQTNVQAQAKGAVSSGEGITYQGSSDMVFAFETAQIGVDLGELDQGKIDINLASMPASIYAFREQADLQKLAKAYAVYATGNSSIAYFNKDALKQFTSTMFYKDLTGSYSTVPCTTDDGC